MLVELETIREKLKSFLTQNYDYISPVVADKFISCLISDNCGYKSIFKDGYGPTFSIGDSIYYQLSGTIRNGVVKRIIIQDTAEVIHYEIVSDNGESAITAAIFATEKEAIYYLNLNSR